MRPLLFSSLVGASTLAAFIGCSSASSDAEDDAEEDGGLIPGDVPDGSKPRVDGGFQTAQGVLRDDRFITRIVSFEPGECAGFGADEAAIVVAGPPVGAGRTKGSLDVLSLGIGGTVVVSFEPNAIVDGDGPDFIVFENAFFAAGNPSAPAADPGEVSVSEDGVTWKTFPCSPGATAPYGDCAGWHPVLSAPGNGISPVDPSVAGGEAYDLAKVGLTRAKFIRIVDRSASAGCAAQTPKPTNLGFDLDAIAIVHAAKP